MIHITYLPYVLLAPALILGFMLGWYWRAARRGDGSNSPANHMPSELISVPNPTPPDPDEVQSELEYLDGKLAFLNESITSARHHVEELEDEHTQLLVNVDSRLAAIQEARNKLYNVEEDLRTEQDKVLADIDASGEELEALKQLAQTYTNRINLMAQQIQRQNSELQMLRQAVKGKTAEMDEARGLIEQRDNELRRLIRQRQQREADVTRLREQLAQRNEELRRLLEQQERSGLFTSVGCPAKQERHHRRDVTPTGQPRLAPRSKQGLPDGRD